MWSNHGPVTMTKSDIDEILVQLYLRVNGYFTTGLIAHSSEWGRARTEVDCLAVRHPHYGEPERQIRPSEFLGVNEGKIDLILCEVKSEPQMIGFNRALREDGTALTSILRWSGLFPEEQLDAVAGKLRPLLQDDVGIDCAKVGVVEEGVRIRALTSCPSADAEDTDRWCLIGCEILGYLNQCFNPEERRDSCSTRYNFQQWGFPFEPIVRYIKNANRTNPTELSLQGVYETFGVA